MCVYVFRKYVSEVSVAGMLMESSAAEEGCAASRVSIGTGQAVRLPSNFL